MDNTLEASVIPDIDVIGVNCLADAVGILTGEKPMPTRITHPIIERRESYFAVDFSHIVGQEHAKRALLISAAGGHNLLMQ